MEPINHTQLLDYFKSLQENLKGLEGFYRMDLTEIRAAFRSGVPFPAMVLESHEGSFDQSIQNNSINTIFFAFTIYDNPEKENYNQQNEMLTNAEALGLKIIARMRYDAAQPAHFLFTNFDVSTVKYNKVGPIFSEKLYGFRFTGEIVNNHSLKINPTDWLDSPTSCTK